MVVPGWTCLMMISADLLLLGQISTPNHLVSLSKIPSAIDETTIVVRKRGEVLPWRHLSERATFGREISSTKLPVCMNSLRFVTIQTSALAKLRKATGYSVAKCKKALELHPDDTEKAEQWLHAEAQKGGWSKIGNLQNKLATQGLVGICAQNSSSAMVEVNCESDFVARNAEFQSFVAKVLAACVSHAAKQVFNQDFTKMYLNSDELNSLKYENSSLADLAALATGKFGEKTVLKRATCIRTKGDIMLSSFAHPSNEFSTLPGAVMGKFGTLLAYQQKISASSTVDRQVLVDLGHRLCQHIVGMNPASLGEFTCEDIISLQREKKMHEDVETDATSDAHGIVTASGGVNETSTSSEDDQNSSDEDNTNELEEKAVDANETRLLHQTFLLDPNKVVGEVLASLSVEIIDFERFECGESINS